MTIKKKKFSVKNKRVLITGGSGFKGTYLAKMLKDLGAKVFCTVRDKTSPNSAFDILGLGSRVRTLNVDISKPQEVMDMVNQVAPDIIIHLAAVALVPVAKRDPRRTYEVNLMGTLNLLEACRHLRLCKRFLVVSTDHVFGKTQKEEVPIGGFLETSRVSYGGAYDTSKAAMELMVRSYYYEHWADLPTIGITRCANVFGFGDPNLRRVIPLFVDAAINTGVIPLKYKKNGRQFIHVLDAISGYIKAVASLDEGGFEEKKGKEKPSNIKSPFTPTFHFAIESYQNTKNKYFITMRELAKVVTSSFDGAKIGTTKDYTDYAPGENPVQALNCLATKEKLNWAPKISLYEGIAKLGEWYGTRSSDKIYLRDLINRDINFAIDLLLETINIE